MLREGLLGRQKDAVRLDQGSENSMRNEHYKSNSVSDNNPTGVGYSAFFFSHSEPIHIT